MRLDLARSTCSQRRKDIRLTPIEYKLLSALVRNRGHLLMHNVLLQIVWGSAYADDRQTLRAHIANLRRKLGLRARPGRSTPISPIRASATCSTPPPTRRRHGDPRAVCPSLVPPDDLAGPGAWLLAESRSELGAGVATPGPNRKSSPSSSPKQPRRVAVRRGCRPHYPSRRSARAVTPPGPRDTSERPLWHRL